MGIIDDDEMLAFCLRMGQHGRHMKICTVEWK